MKPTYEPTETFPAALRTWAEKDPDRAFLHEVGGSSQTYGEVHEATLRWADAFRRIGVQPGENVAAMVRTSITAEEQWLGLGWLRAVHTGVNTDFRGSSLAYVVNQSRARRALCAFDLLDRIAEVAGLVPSLEQVIVVGAEGHELPHDFPFPLVSDAEIWAASTPATDLAVPERHDIACINYTSGTTGASKGVLIPWGRIWPDVAWLDMTPEDVYYAPFPISHISGMLPLAWLGFPGGQVVLRESFKTQHWWDDIRAFGCTATALIPIMMNWLLDQPARADDLDNPLRHVAGAPVIRRIEQFKQRFGVEMRTMYGTTEVGMSLYAGPDVGADLESQGLLAAPGFEVRVVDEHDNTTGFDEIGELIVRTDPPWRMMTGYFDMPEKSAEAWRNGWFHTGDAFVRNEEGRFYFVDRLSDSMRRRGENVSSMEVEAFVNEHPAVAEAAAIGVASGDGEQEIKVCVVLNPDQPLSHSDLHGFLQGRMPAFMVPRYIEFVDDPERTDAMKRIKKMALRVDPLNEATWDADTQR
jgi:crotonobetaine/carnitine-CoA ligase